MTFLVSRSAFRFSRSVQNSKRKNAKRIKGLSYPVEPQLEAVLYSIRLTGAVLDEQMLVLRRDAKLTVKPHVHIRREACRLVVILVSSRVERIKTHSYRAYVVKHPDLGFGELSPAIEVSSRSDRVSSVLNPVKQVDPLDRISCVERETLKVVLEEGNG